MMTAEAYLSAYRDGFAAGRADWLLGIRSAYAWRGIYCDMPNTYSYRYSAGYHDGYTGRTR